MRSGPLCLAVLALVPLATGFAIAQPVSGLYVGAGAGANFHQNTTSGGSRVHTEVGPVGLLGLGWGFGNGLRVELEGNYRENDIDTLLLRNIGGSFSARPSTGRVTSYGGMANLLYEGSLGLLGQPLQPYLGAGIGYAAQEYRNVAGAVTFVGTGPGRRVFDDTDGRFAYQAIGGVALPIGLAPGLAATAEYRFLGIAGEARIDGRNETAGGTVLSSGTSRFTNFNHSLMLGLRYAFNAPVPSLAAEAAVPAEPPAASRTYLVFFDWDRADLTDRARQIIAEAAAASRRVPTTRIEVAGHADRSGTPQYNQRLSERRAETVAAELVARGVNRAEITLTALGESRPLVPTADGVREPQNRRVEIILR